MSPRYLLPLVCFVGLLLAGTAAAGERPFTEYPAAAKERYDQGREFQKQGRYQDAIAAYREAMDLGMKDYPRLHLSLASCYEKLLDHAGTISAYTTFIEQVGLEKSCRR